LKKNYKLYFLLMGALCMLLNANACFMYTFSGSSLSKEAKTFTIQEFQSRIALGPANLSETVTQALRNEIMQKTTLKETVDNGDIQLDGIITDFKYTPINKRSNDLDASSSRIQLTITVQMNYSNKFDQDFEFTKKQFTQHTDIDAKLNIDAEENNMVDEILQKLVKDIFNASIANW